MHRIVLAIAAAALLAAAAPGSESAGAAGLATKPPPVTADTDLTQNLAYTCRRAWRCGPYDCGWRQVCGWAGWRPYWRSHRYYWRRHQWRQHYW